MEYLVICLVALVVAALTLFSGFGLGTLLMPAFAVFFPLNVAVAATAIVHLANNVFKVFLVGKHADIKTVVRFSLPAVAFAIAGAYLLGYLSHFPSLTQYTVGNRTFEITVIKLVMAVIIAFFAIWDLSPALEKLEFDPKFIPVGGALSGFFGGLSGLQGALRSAFLIRCGLAKEAFIATGVVSTVAVDTSRLIIYGTTFMADYSATISGGALNSLVFAGTVSAFAGSFIGSRMMKKVTMKAVQLIVGAMLILMAAALGLGLI